VTVSRIGKAAFNQVLTTFEISFGCLGGGDVTGLVQEFLLAMSVNSATAARAGTEGFWSCSRAVCSMALTVAGSSGLTELRAALASTKLALH
jgi:hypothetical protein